MNWAKHRFLFFLFFLLFMPRLDSTRLDLTQQYWFRCRSFLIRMGASCLHVFCSSFLYHLALFFVFFWHFGSYSELSVILPAIGFSFYHGRDMLCFVDSNALMRLARLQGWLLYTKTFHRDGTGHGDKPKPAIRRTGAGIHIAIVESLRDHHDYPICAVGCTPYHELKINLK